MDTNVIGNGVNSSVELQVDPTAQAARVSLRALEWQPTNGTLGGHYSISAPSGAIGAGGVVSGGQIFQLRWNDSAKFFVLKKLKITTSVTTAFAAGQSVLEAMVGHGSTANGSGGTAITPNNTSNRLRSTMSPSSIATAGEIRVSSTGATTAATGQTLEPLGIGSAQMSAAGTTAQYLFEQRDQGTHPLILNNSDTLVIKATTIAGTGVWSFSVDMEWVEAATY